jgi:DNA-binding transcriptional ArsR family regulator/uncharacterized protein YndB with AHSA1/START domain
MHDMDAVFRALSDPARRRLLDRLNRHDGLTLTELRADMGMTRQSVSKHLDVLAEAGLVVTLRRGREKLHFLNAAPINDIADRWIHHYDRARAQALADLKTALEAGAMGTHSDQTTFVYTTYIRATPEQVWQGLTEPAFTKRYWGGVEFRSDWRVGSTYDVADEDAGLVIGDPAQVVLESDPYRRLAYAWHTFTPEWGARHGKSEAEVARWSSEPRSRVAFDIEHAGPGVVKLTVVHDGFEPGSEILDGVSGGWPAVLAGLKTLLETGTALPAA